MYKAVFLDLDGTLFDDNKKISNENKLAIQKAKENGAIVCICSGRQQNFVKVIREETGASRYIICSNGTQIYDCETGEEIFAMTIEEEIILDLFAIAEAKDYVIKLDTKYGKFINSDKYFFPTEMVIKEDYEKFLSENKVLQVTIATDTEEQLDEVIRYITGLNRIDIKVYNKYFGITKEGREFWAMNIINSHASKGNAITGLCKYLKIDVNEVIAMGDDINDVSMMQAVGMGIAMGNACNEVKLYAKEVTKTNNENGVAKAINEKF